MLFKADMRPSEERMPAVILKKWMINAKNANGSKQQRGMWGGVSRNAEKNSGAVFDVKPTAQDIRGATCYFLWGQEKSFFPPLTIPLTGATELSMKQFRKFIPENHHEPFPESASSLQK